MKAISRFLSKIRPTGGTTVAPIQRPAQAADIGTGVINDYHIRNGAIRSRHLERVAHTAYTPVLGATVTAPNLGSGGSITGRYYDFGSRIDVYAEIVFAGVGVFAGQGDFTLSLPMEAQHSPHRMLGGTWHIDQAGVISDFKVQIDGTNYGYVRAVRPNGSPTGGVLVFGAAVPFAITAGAVIQIEFSYEPLAAVDAPNSSPGSGGQGAGGDGGSGGSGNPGGTAVALSWTTQPADTTEDIAMPSIVVKAVDANGATVTDHAGDVTIAIGANPGSGTLTRTSLQYPSALATLTGLNTTAGTDNLGFNIYDTNGRQHLGWWAADGQGFTIVATVPTTGTYTFEQVYANGITPPASAYRRVTVNGSVVAAAHEYPTTSAWDSYLTTPLAVSLNAGANTITVDFDGATGSSGYIDHAYSEIDRTPVQSLVAGTAVVDGLVINNPGAGYTFVASSPGLTSATSSTFTIATNSPGGGGGGGGIGSGDKVLGMNAVFTGSLVDLMLTYDQCTEIRVEFPYWPAFASTTGGWTVNHWYGTEDPAVVLLMAASRGVRVLPILSSGPPGSLPADNAAFAAAAVQFALRYCAGGTAWASGPLAALTAYAPTEVELLNEPYFSNQPLAYIDLMSRTKSGYDAAGLTTAGIGILGANTDNSAGSWGAWNETIIAAGGWSPYCTGVTVHPYGPAYLPSDPNNGHGWGCVLRAYQQSGLPVSVTEIGWGTPDPVTGRPRGAGGGAPDQSTKNLWTTNILTEWLNQPYIKRVNYYAISNEAEADYAPDRPTWNAVV